MGRSFGIEDFWIGMSGGFEDERLWSSRGSVLCSPWMRPGKGCSLEAWHLRCEKIRVQCNCAWGMRTVMSGWEFGLHALWMVEARGNGSKQDGK